MTPERMSELREHCAKPGHMLMRDTGNELMDEIDDLRAQLSAAKDEIERMKALHPEDAVRSHLKPGEEIGDVFVFRPLPPGELPVAWDLLTAYEKAVIHRLDALRKPEGGV